MSVSKKVLLIEKEKLQKDFSALSEQIKQTDNTLQGLRNNLNAVHGAIQQGDKLIQLAETEDKEDKQDGKDVQKS